MKVRFHPEVDAELVEAEAWYRERSEVAAQAFALEIDAAIALILEAPLRWAQKRRGEHRFVLKRFPYTIIYRVHEDHVFVTAVAHHSRRPNYWRHRK